MANATQSSATQTPSDQPITPEQLECMDKLQHSHHFQVLKRLVPKTEFNPPTPGQILHKLCILDTETTGLDTTHCEVIELGYQIIEFDSQGLLYRVLSKQNFLNEPEGEISEEVTQVTGIRFEDVQGQKIDWEAVAEEMRDVQLIIAHNAGFDRPIVERYHAIFSQKVWGCSVNQIDWMKITGIGSRSQEFLCWKLGQFFYDAHRAIDDVQALSQLLSEPLGEDALPALSYLLPAVRKSKHLVKATRAPFELKDDLKARHYRWQPQAKVWQKVIDEDILAEELAWLIENNTPNPDVIKLKATDTFSVRAQA